MPRSRFTRQGRHASINADRVRTWCKQDGDLVIHPLQLDRGGCRDDFGRHQGMRQPGPGRLRSPASERQTQPVRPGCSSAKPALIENAFLADTPANPANRAIPPRSPRLQLPDLLPVAGCLFQYVCKLHLRQFPASHLPYTGIFPF